LLTVPFLLVHFMLGIYMWKCTRFAKVLVTVAFSITGHCAPAQEGESPSHGEKLDRVEVHGKHVRDPAWISYRESYEAMRKFSENVKGSDPLEPSFHLRPMAQVGRHGELDLRLIGKDVNVPIPVKNLWGVMPESKEAFEANADLYLNAPSGSFRLTRTITIRTDQSGQYVARYLKISCARTLEVLRGMSLAYRAKLAFRTCKGVAFYIAPGDDGGAIAAVTKLGVQLEERKTDAPAEYRVKALMFESLQDDDLVDLGERVIVIVPIY